MAASKKTSEEKEFLNISKLLLSSLSGRGAQYIYLNTTKNRCDFVITNSTSSGKDVPHGNRFTTYNISDLALHVVRVNNETYVDELLNILGVTQDSGIVCIRANLLSSYLQKKYRKDRLYTDYSYGAYVLYDKEDKSTEIPVGFKVTDFHLITNLIKHVDHILFIKSEEHKDKFSHTFVPIPIDVDITGRLYDMKISLANYKEFDQKIYRDSVNLVAMDGLTTVSIREFVKKQHDIHYTHELYVWAVDNCLFLAAIYRSALFDIITFKPNTIIAPLPKFNNKEL